MHGFQDDAFDAAAAGVDAIVHGATPVGTHIIEPDEQIVPAREGTLSALRAAVRTPSVRRVVFISTIGAVIDPAGADAIPRPRAYDERDWNESHVREVAEKGRDASGLAKYCASKVIAERAAWEFAKDARAQAAARGEEPRWDLTVLCPTWTLGPVMHEIRGGPEALNVSAAMMYLAIVKRQFLGDS